MGGPQWGLRALVFLHNIPRSWSRQRALRSPLAVHAAPYRAHRWPGPERYQQVPTPLRRRPLARGRHTVASRALMTSCWWWGGGTR